MQVYNTIDKKIHQLVQIVAKFNRSYALAKDDDSHTNIALDVIGQRLLGRWVSVSEGQIIMALNLKKFRFEFFNNDWDLLYVISASGKSQSEIEASIAEYIPKLKLGPKPFAEPLHYEIPCYNIHSFTPFLDNEITIWIKHRSMANDACHWTANHLQTQVEVRIWPHHFDTGIYIEPTPNLGLGFGLAMYDAVAGLPYYYFSAYGLNGYLLNYKSIPKLSSGQWIIEDGWKGAILKLPEVTPETLKQYILEVSGYYLNSL